MKTTSDNKGLEQPTVTATKTQAKAIKLQIRVKVIVNGTLEFVISPRGNMATLKEDFQRMLVYINTAYPEAYGTNIGVQAFDGDEWVNVLVVDTTSDSLSQRDILLN